MPLFRFFIKYSYTAIISVLLLNALSCKEKNKPQDEVTGYLNLHDSVRYVGINTCRECHQDIYKTFIETGMGQSFSLATKEKSSAKFNDHIVVNDSYSGYSYRPFWKDDSLHVLEFKKSGKDTVYKRDETIKYIIGSGQHTNSHFVETNGYITQAPLTFYTQKGKWDLPPGFEKGYNSRFDRVIGLECMSCHNAYPDFVKGSENKYAKVPSGIDCERCHGPGSIHVSEKKKGHLVDITKNIDYSIVNPGKLSAELQFDVCQRCHLQGNAVLKNGKSFFDFKPGMKLSEVMDVYMPKYTDNSSNFIMASHVERLKMSDCFIKSGEKLTCVSCHNPHVSYKKTKVEKFNKTCLSCHQNVSQIVCKEELAVRKRFNDNCTKCHMAKNNTIDIPHVVTTDHFIRKPVSLKEVNKIKAFVGLVCINNDKPSVESRVEGYLNHYEKFSNNPAFLDSASKYLPDISKTSIDLIVRLLYAQKKYNEVITTIEKVRVLRNGLKSWNNEDAWLKFRVGDSYLNSGDYQKAFNYLNQAVNLAPFNLDFNNKLGASLVSLNRYSEARAVFKNILKENPKFVAALSNLGYMTLIIEDDMVTADSYYEKALSLDPDYEQALMNKAGLLMYQNKMKEAEKYLYKVLKRNPQNEMARQALGIK